MQFVVICVARSVHPRASVICSRELNLNNVNNITRTAELQDETSKLEVLAY